MDYTKILRTSKEIESLLRSGYDTKKIKKNIKNYSDEALSIARAKIKNNRIKKIPENYVFAEEDLRFSTNILVAKHRAKRLACKTIVDIGCGIGIQAIEFSKTCKNIIAIEIDPRKIKYAIANAEIARARNIAFMNEDALSALPRIKSADIMFWDPERPSSETEKTTASFNPPFESMLKKMEQTTKGICIELPPQISKQTLPDCELEYISINNDLNRLNAYFGSLKLCNMSAVALPSSRMVKDTDKKAKLKESKIKHYLYEIDQALKKAGLLSQLYAYCNKAGIFKINNEIYITSDKQIASPFLKAYEVIATTKKDEIIGVLNSRGIGKAILHGKIPQRDYWPARNKIEKKLNGNKTAHLFFNKDSIIVCLGK